MTTNAQDILKAARALPPHEQIEVLQGLARSLAQTLSPLAQGTTEFWTHRSIEDLAREQHTPVITDLHDLVMADWPNNESVDDLIGYIRDQRHADTVG
ncbi:MAG: hypothetical protein ACRDHP_05500 [Ktedonobacterales bacterium]